MTLRGKRYDAGRHTTEDAGSTGSGDDARDGGDGRGRPRRRTGRRGGRYAHYADGQQIDGGEGTFDTVPQSFVGGGEITPAPYTEMDVGAVLVYDRALTEEERQRVEDYLDEKYAR